MTFTGTLDPRFSEATDPLDWAKARDVLSAAELYWPTTVRADGRPHVTPLVGLWSEDTFVFCTGPEEQKARNLLHNNTVAVTTGTNTWSDGMDATVDGFSHGDGAHTAHVYRIAADKVLVFTKAPHGQTRYLRDR